MFSESVWKLARRPNYITNEDKMFPYSEIPYLGEFDLVKIPISLSSLIKHVDYWGEGKIVLGRESIGFSDSYNINHQYQLVSDGEDRVRKIPNRIPVPSYTNCDTSAYIKDNSVITVTVTGTHLNSSCAKDIARIVNSDLGSVVVYGLEYKSPEIEALKTELEKKELFYCPDYDLPGKLKDVTVFSDHVAFLNINMLKDDLRNKILSGSISRALNLSNILILSNKGAVISDVVVNILRGVTKSSTRNVMVYAYKLWYSGAKDAVRNYFPQAFQFIFNNDHVVIVNKEYHQALKLDVKTDSYNDRLAWGDKSDASSKRVSWKIVPEWYNDTVTFKLYNIEYDMYLKLDANVNNVSDRKVWGSKNTNEERLKFFLEPIMVNDVLAFFIINYKYYQGLKLDSYVDYYGDRILFGHNGSVYDNHERLKWIIRKW